MKLKTARHVTAVHKSDAAIVQAKRAVGCAHALEKLLLSVSPVSERWKPLLEVSQRCLSQQGTTAGHSRPRHESGFALRSFCDS
jgi:hypothetical protein